VAVGKRVGVRRTKTLPTPVARPYVQTMEITGAPILFLGIATRNSESGPASNNLYNPFHPSYLSTAATERGGGALNPYGLAGTAM